MVKTVAILAFIGAAGAGAFLLSQKRTVIDGKVMAADLMKQLENKGITEMACDREIPVGTAGAVFRCKVSANDGSTAQIEYTIDRNQQLSGKVLDGTGPTRQEVGDRVPSSSDPWAN
jgi:uncharacterized protein DUF4333